MKGSKYNLIELVIQTFGEYEPDDGFPIFFSHHVVNHHIFCGPAVPFFAVFALGPMMVLFLIAKNVLYWVGKRLLLTL